MAIRFYNPGFKISELMRFDHPTNDPKVQNLISYYRVEAEPKSFFDVPTETAVDTAQGEQFVSVRFADRIQKEYKEHAVIRINPKAVAINDDDNVAVNEKDAKDKGERLWVECMKHLVREHESAVAVARTNGQRPLAASGNTKYALKLLKIEDPANDIDTVLSRRQDTGEVEALKKSLADMQAQMNQLLAKAAR